MSVMAPGGSGTVFSQGSSFLPPPHPTPSSCRTPAVVRHQRQHSVRDPALQRVPVRHRQKRGDAGVPPDGRHRGLPHGGPLLRAAQPVGRAAGPRGGERRPDAASCIVVLSAPMPVLTWAALHFQAFAQSVLSKADVIQATGDAVCIFKELQCLTPRGRYCIDESLTRPCCHLKWPMLTCWIFCSSLC